jgi:nicotinamide phosphoribosyltransferase
MQCLSNLLLNTDSYKASHWLQYPPGTDATFFYVESRGGRYDRTLFYGLQAIVKDSLARPITQADIAEARDVFAAHGEPFNEAGWRSIIDRHGGHMPIRIRAVPEGTVVPTHQALVTIESTDPAAYWVPSYLETLLLRLWYPVTVATISWHIKQTIRQFLERTSDEPVEQLRFKLHDFGARGVSSAESAALGGSAHLVNFAGTDNVLALMAARAHYHEPMAGFSIPAAEHSTITSWGRENEVEAYRNMLRQFARPGAVVAVVSDSYDIYRAIREHWGKTLRDEVIKSGATLVVRPDSGDPVEVVHKCLVLLDEAFGHTMTSKGYKVLNYVRVIQGDGINPDSLRAILERATAVGYAADNLTFGMGGGLLQQLHRDTQKFALKCSAARIEGRWIDVYKEPITDPGKQSKRGRMTLLRHRELGTFLTVPVPSEAQSLADVVTPPGFEDAMVTVWENGELLRDWTFAEVRSRADAARLSGLSRS